VYYEPLADPSIWLWEEGQFAGLGSIQPEFWALAGLAVIADLRPFPAGNWLRPVSRLFVSLAFTFAILLVWGVVPAVAVQTLAVGAGAIRLRRGLAETVGLMARFALAFAAAGAVLSLPGAPDVSVGVHISGTDAVYFAGAGAAWFVTAFGSSALYVFVRDRQSLRQEYGRSAFYQYLSTAALLLLSPLIVGAPTGWALILAVIPVLAVNQIVWLSGRLDAQLRHDALTGLLSRPAIIEAVTDLLSFQERPGPVALRNRFALLLIDLDRFKQVNDTLGHDLGDQLLVVVAQRLKAAVPPTALVGRYGADEFAILARGVDQAAANQIADDITRALASPATIDSRPLYVGGAIGMAFSPEDGDDQPTLTRHADLAMYQAKGRAHPVVRYSTELDTTSTERLSLLADLRRALEDPAHRAEIALLYQPQMRIGTGEVVGVEALLRWVHPERGPVSVEDILQVAELTPVIHTLTRRVVHEVTHQVAEWNRLGIHIRASLNVSVRDLETPDLVSYLTESLTHARVPANQITVEVTETAVIGDLGPSAATLGAVAALGVAVSLDDFGTGYSSLAHLRSLPVSEIKIDRSFVARMVNDPEDKTIVESIVKLGRALKLGVVAEGVEDEATARQLAAAGCETAQGWLYAAAMNPNEFQAWITDTPERAAAVAPAKPPPDQPRPTGQ
jgi:diguanylate cyclase (GGDEF)-like protein